MGFFDSHAHLDDQSFDLDREIIIQDIKKSETTNFISAGYNLKSSEKALELARKYEFIYATCGISPNDIPQNEEKLWKDILSLEKIVQKEDKKIVAIGEIGLDYYWEKNIDRRKLQKKACIKQIEIANKYNLPIVIHVREAIMDMLDILKNHPVNKKGVFHCCPQNRELIKEALKLGFYISFAGPITFKNSKNADEMINLVPNDKLLIETDSPYLSPEPVRGRRNTPINVKYIAQKIANVKNMHLQDVAQITNNNTRKLFNIS